MTPEPPPDSIQPRSPPYNRIILAQTIMTMRSHSGRDVFFRGCFLKDLGERWGVLVEGRIQEIEWLGLDGCGWLGMRMVVEKQQHE